MKISNKGLAFLSAHEGFVGRAYLDPVGIITIGYGFTTRGRVFKRMWGKPLRMGDTITRAQADRILGELISEEYGAYVTEVFGDLPQHQFDACVSNVYNLGPKTLKWKWAQALKAGNVSLAAKLLKTTGTTASGKKLAGLVRRRQEESLLLEKGIYTGVSADGVQRHETSGPAMTPDPVTREAQELLTARGFNPGAIDGWMGRKTKAAVLEYQKAHPHLTNDGILGKATLTQLRRDAASVKDAVQKGGSSVAGSGAVAWASGFPWQWVIAGAVVCAVVYFGWKYRDVVQRRVNSLLGREVK